MKRSENDKHVVNLDPYTIRHSTPHRATNASSIHARRVDRRQLYVHPSFRVTRKKKSRSRVAKAFDTLGRILVFTFFIGSPFIVAIVLGRHFLM